MAGNNPAEAPLLAAAAEPSRAWPRPGGEGRLHSRRQDLYEWSSLLCIAYVCTATVAILWALMLTGIGGRWPEIDPREVWHCEASILMVSSAIVMEMCFLMSSSMNIHTLGDRCKSQLRLNGIGDSMLTLTEYGLKVATGLYLSLSNGGIVHMDVQASGGPRPVYFARFAQWSVAVPLLVLLTNRSFCARTADIGDYIRWAPGLLASSLYCWAAWIMEVTTDPTLRWSFLVLSMTGAVIVSVDQLCLARAHKGEELYGWKFGMLIYQIASFALYAVVFFFGRFGMVSSLTEQGIYAYADATVKVFQGAISTMIRNREDLNSIKRWWVAALNATQDLENIVSTACVPVFAIDLEGRVVEWNDNLRKLTGMPFDTVRGRPLADLVTPECRPAVEAGVQHAMQISRAAAAKAEEGPFSDEDVTAAKFATNFVEISIPVARARANEAKLRNLAMTLVPKSTPEGALAGVVAIGQDLSDLAQLKIVQERKSALIAMLSHEIRSPLHGMVGLTTAMLESQAGASMRRQLGMVKGCAVRLLDLVTNIMDLAQSEKRRLDNRPLERPSALVDFGAIVDEVHTMTKMAVDKMNKPLLKPSVRFVNNLEGQQAPLIHGDPQKCTQLIYNLVTNACKFTERGSVTVTAHHDKEKKRLEVEVSDTGKGISKEGQRRIFQAFEQEQSGDTRGFQGIGLGLAVCTEIADLHGGELRVSSDLGHGSKFTACFPCEGDLGYGSAAFGGEAAAESPASSPAAASEKSAAPMPEEQKSREAAQAQRAAPTQAAQRAQVAPVPQPPQQTEPQPLPPQPVCLLPPQTALVLSVDDDEVNQEVIESAIGSVCDVQRAMDGLQALKYLQERRSMRQRLPDMVLLDIQMPGMSGFEVCSEIRQKLLLGHDLLPIIMISARAPTDQTAIESFETGATDFVAKPFNTEVLKRKLMAALQAKAESERRGAQACQAYGGQLKAVQGRLLESEQKAKALEQKAEGPICSLQGQLRPSGGDAPEASEPTPSDLQDRLQRAEAHAARLQERLDASEARSEQLRKRLGEALQQREPKFDELSASMERLRRQLERSERAAAAPVVDASAPSWRLAADLAAGALGGDAGAFCGERIRELAEDLGERKDFEAEDPGAGEDNFLPLGGALKAHLASLGVSDDVSTSDENGPDVRLHRAVRVLLSQLSRSRATVRILGSRLDILHSASRVCVELTDSPGSGQQKQEVGEMAQGSQAFELQGYKDMSHLLRSQLMMMAQISAPSDLTAFATRGPALPQIQSGATDDATMSDTSTPSMSSPPPHAMPKDIVGSEDSGYKDV